jgi:hypothetical protein
VVLSPLLFYLSLGQERLTAFQGSLNGGVGTVCKLLYQKCYGKYLHLRVMDCENEENYVMRNFIIFLLHMG